ncbi:MAG: phosphoenolpyruvate carboxykinase (ATP) [Candidatus Latescibacteria bacterium]|nr:phosphoenolpyruvate carboxykinase (ATP) [Candidatus Latescibacterota bacterium]
MTIEIKPKALIKNLNKVELRNLAGKDEITTEFSSASYVSHIRSRSAKFTEIIDNEPNAEQSEIIKRVLEYITKKTMVMVERTMCQSDQIDLLCRFYVTKDFARNAFMWHEMLFESAEKSKSDLTVVSIPEWPERKVLVLPKQGITFILGSDYTGEVKKAFLRMAMYVVKQRGWLGLHAGSKMIKVKDKTQKLIKKGVLLFGLSGTGKTTLTCHHHFLQGDEGVIIKQDDVVFLLPDGSAIGTEKNFYAKTEGLSPKTDPLLYQTATSHNAILENVLVEENGTVDFQNCLLTSNGRAVVMRQEMAYTDNSINLPYANVLIFICRRNDIIPPVIKLTPEQGAAFFMLGESVETSAGDPTQVGKSKRVVGTNPLIIGPESDEGNRFYNILKAHPDMEAYVLNTGRVGGENGEKITVQESVEILTQIGRGSITWQVDPDWNYLIPTDIPNIDLKLYNPMNYYAEEEYQERVQTLKQERKKWLSKYPTLSKEITESMNL